MSVFESKKAPALAAKAAPGVFAACAAALAAAVFALAGCSYPSAPTGADELSLALQASAKPNADGTINVVVPLPAGGGGSDPVTSISRSLNTAGVRYDIEDYEVIFRNNSEAADLGKAQTYYRGSGSSGKGFVTVPVYPGHSYDVLLIGGKDKVLLAAGYTAGVSITAGVANTVTITVYILSPQWINPAADDTDTNKIIYPTGESLTPDNLIANLNDFQFTVTGLASGYSDTSLVEVNRGGRFIHIAPKAKEADSLPAVSSETTTFQVDFNIAKFVPLIYAEKGYITLQSYYARLEPLPGQASTEAGFFKPVNLIAVNGTTSPQLGHTSGKFKLIDSGYAGKSTGYISFINTLTDTASGRFTAKNVEGILRFELYYKAFGGPATVSDNWTQWTIRNGLSSAPDDGEGAGGDFSVLIGTGLPPGLTNVDVPNGSLDPAGILSF
ncbi:MAG: hypothetical protein LBU18_01170 [Treponema sp.]|jgi:hypothetical protein|nr:hypothetical protein [Treponema sp.]